MIAFFEVLAVAISSRSSFDRHDLAIDSFGYTVGNPMRAKRHDVSYPLLDGSGNFLHTLQPRVNDTPVPFLEERSSSSAIGLRPQVSQQFLLGPGSPCFEFPCTDRFESNCLTFVVIPSELCRRPLRTR